MPMPNSLTGSRGIATTETNATPRPPLLPVCLEAVEFKAGGEPLINDLSLTLLENERTVVMGPNGSGKTLLLRLMHGLIEPTAGRVLWAGVGLTTGMRRRQAMVFQKPVLLRRSVAANIDFALSLVGRMNDENRAELLDRVGLGALGNRPARKLSGGEQQRLALARALAFNPDVLFLDEPTASLDPGSAQMIEDVMHWAHLRGTKVILVTHDIGQARRLADDVVFLHHGCLAEHTSAEKFFDNPQSQAAQDFLAGRIVL